MTDDTAIWVLRWLKLPASQTMTAAKFCELLARKLDEDEEVRLQFWKPDEAPQ